MGRVGPGEDSGTRVVRRPPRRSWPSSTTYLVSVLDAGGRRQDWAGATAAPPRRLRSPRWRVLDERVDGSSPASDRAAWSPRRCVTSPAYERAIAAGGSAPLASAVSRDRSPPAEHLHFLDCLRGVAPRRARTPRAHRVAGRHLVRRWPARARALRPRGAPAAFAAALATGPRSLQYRPPKATRRRARPSRHA